MSWSIASAIVATSATAIPAIPNVFPDLAVSCRDSPASARMNNNAATMYAACAAVSTESDQTSAQSSAQLTSHDRENMPSIRWVTANPPNTLMRGEQDPGERQTP